MKTLALSGWGQPADALRALAPEAATCDYGAERSLPAVYATLGGQRTDIVIGWSLGAQLALRATMEGALRPRLLVLLAAPYQFVAGGGFASGMPAETFEAFRRNYAGDPRSTVEKFAGLIAKGDKKEREVRRALAQDEEAQRVDKWQPWLDELGKFSCSSLDFSGLPPVLLVQGSEDAIVRISQYHALRSAIPHAEGALWDECGHAPHLHDAPRLRQLIEERIRRL